MEFDPEKVEQWMAIGDKPMVYASDYEKLLVLWKAQREALGAFKGDIQVIANVLYLRERG